MSVHAAARCARTPCDTARPRAPSSPARVELFDHHFARIRVHARDGGGSNAQAARCKQFPGGSTDCVIDPQTGTPTGRVTSRVDETNPCTRPCVEQHEAVHVRQMQKLCAEIRDCYAAADRGTRSASDCFKLAIGSSAKNECEAYAVSVPCVERRLRTAPECRSAGNQRYGTEKLQSERCWRDHYCGSAT